MAMNRSDKAARDSLACAASVSTVQWCAGSRWVECSAALIAGSVSAAAQPVTVPRSCCSGQRVAHLEDPDGNAVNLTQPV